MSAYKDVIFSNVPGSMVFSSDSFLSRLHEDEEWADGGFDALVEALRECSECDSDLRRAVFAIYRHLLRLVQAHMNPIDSFVIRDPPDDLIPDIIEEFGDCVEGIIFA